MLADAATSILGLVEFRCSLRLTSLAFPLIFLINAVYCAESQTLNSSSQFLPSEAPQPNTPTEFLNAVGPAKTLEQQELKKYVSDRISEDSSSLRRHQSSGTNSLDITSSEFSDDYGDYAHYDDFNPSYVGPEVVVDLAPEEMVLSMEDGAPPQGKRKPVKDGFIRDQEIELLRLHNYYRSNVTPAAADMSFMEWDDELARIAQLWANGCQFRHGFPPNSYSGNMGQNLYMGFDPTGVRALLLWYEEYDFYNFGSRECSPEKQCGHYTQLVWGGSSLIGCGMKRCGYKRFFVVCHYSPPGNIATNSPYTVGKPCSQCSSEHGGLCINKLCVTEDQCSRNKETCFDAECQLECHNCGTLNSTLCKCWCADGWDSLDCSRRCRNDHVGCGRRDGFPTPTYCSMYQHDIANVHCRAMCGRCRHVEELNATSTCCNGVLCGDGYVLDQKENLCKCKLLCPGPKCYEDSRILNKNVLEQDNGPAQANISTEGRGPIYRNTSHGDNSTMHKNVSDKISGLHEDNGATSENAPDSECEITCVNDDDSGSQYCTISILMILLPLIAQILFLS